MISINKNQLTYAPLLEEKKRQVAFSLFDVWESVLLRTVTLENL
ncbi:hypothetical protein B481_2723 [Planococcus halocryophilus Or1]|nr:hypothetical protein B481_2723 [Planococcus halocryophilus Or1]